MTVITIHAKRPVGGFEETYPRAPFAELIRLTLAAAEAVAKLARRGEERGTEAGRPAMVS